MQLAKYFGTELTGVCSNRKQEMIKSLGADRVIDYTRDDLTKSVTIFDFALDSVSKASSLTSTKIPVSESVKRLSYFLKI